MIKVAEKALAVLEIVLTRVLSPEAKERAYKLAITKRKMKAMEAAEQFFVEFDMDYVDMLIRESDPDDSARKVWEKKHKLYREAKRAFFKYNS